MTPSLAKLDVEALKRDILNKYLKNMPRAASDDWRVWLENVETENHQCLIIMIGQWTS